MNTAIARDQGPETRDSDDNCVTLTFVLAFQLVEYRLRVTYYLNDELVCTKKKDTIVITTIACCI